jgi:hypothetical protein
VIAIPRSSEYVICGFQNKRVGVVSLRAERVGPILGIQTQPFTPLQMMFDGDTHTLYMFALREAAVRDAFATINRMGKQTIFRKYPGFV